MARLAGWLAALASLGGAAASGHACLEADNFLNAQYTVKIQVGTPPQDMHVVADTGSFEGVFASAECTGCGNHLRFDRGASQSFQAKSPAEKITTLYGQGKVVSEAVYDRVQVGELVAEQQSVLLMQQNELRDYSDAAYDGVMGLGVPSVARSQDPTDLSLMSNLNVSTVSLCFGQLDGDKGRIELGARPANDTIEFVELPLLGDQHWGVRLDGISVGGNQVKGCEAGCNAIIDSGTSLIAAPSEMLPSILEMIGDVDPNCEGIENLPTIEVTLAGHAFQLDPHMYVAKMDISDDDTAQTSLSGLSALQQQEQPTEEGAVADADADEQSRQEEEGSSAPQRFDPLQGFRRRVHSLHAGRSSSGGAAAAATAPTQLGVTAKTATDSSSSPPSSVSSHEQCVALFMDMDMVTSLPGRPFILGIPWLRAFVAKFNRDSRTIGLASVPVGSTYCTSCGATGLASSTVAAAASTGGGAFGAAHFTTLAAKAKGASNLASGPRHTAATANALQPTADEERAASLEVSAPHAGGARSGTVHTQLMRERVVLLGGSSVNATSLGGSRSGSGAKAPQQQHAAHGRRLSGQRFSPPAMRMSQLRVPMWLQQAHGQWLKQSD